MPGPMELALGDVVTLRKPHACGGADWVVVRLGADIGLRCLTCKRRVLLPRRELERRVKSLRHGDQASETSVEDHERTSE